MKFNKDWLNRKWVDYTIAACIAVAFFLFLSHINVFISGFFQLFAFMRPVLIGVVIAYVLNPMMVLYERLLSKKITRKKEIHTLAVVGTVVTVILLVTLLMVALIPQLVSSVMTLVANMNGYVTSFQALVQSAAGESAAENEIIASLIQAGDSLLTLLKERMPMAVTNVISAAGSIGMNVFNSVISFIMAVYFLSDKERLLGGCARFLRLTIPENRYADFADFWSRCHRILIRYIGGDLLDGLIVGLTNFIFMLVMQMPYAALVSVLVGVTNLAPTFGPLAGAVIGGFILVLINPWHALWFIIFTIVLQTLDGYVIKPKLFGGTLGVPAVWILICIIVGGRMFGVPGILLAIPFAAISDYIYKEMIIHRLEAARGIDGTGTAAAETAAGSGDLRASGVSAEDALPDIGLVDALADLGRTIAAALRRFWRWLRENGGKAAVRARETAATRMKQLEAARAAKRAEKAAERGGQAEVIILPDPALDGDGMLQEPAEDNPEEDNPDELCSAGQEEEPEDADRAVDDPETDKAEEN